LQKVTTLNIAAVVAAGLFAALNGQAQSGATG
jgi:hypothetical protein